MVQRFLCGLVVVVKKNATGSTKWHSLENSLWKYYGPFARRTTQLINYLNVSVHRNYVPKMDPCSYSHSFIIIIIIIIIITAIEFSFCGNSHYTSTDKTNKNK